jgi:hypothetical protein
MWACNELWHRGLKVFGEEVFQLAFRRTLLDDFIRLDTTELRRSSYKNLGYPLGCSCSELDAALGDGDFALESSQGQVVGFVRIKAMLARICYFDLHLLADADADADCGLEALIARLSADFRIGKYYVQLLPYESREIACLERQGFTEEARMRAQVFVDGGYYDLVMMGSPDNRV